MIGKAKENGFWIARKPNYRFMIFRHDSLYIAFWKLRFRVMKPKGWGE